MAGPLELNQTVTNYLNQKRLNRFFNQMGSHAQNHLTPNEYFAYLQVITWVVQKKLQETPDFPTTQISEKTITPIVHEILEKNCLVLPEDVGFVDPMPPYLLSRIIWYTSSSLG